MPEKDFLLVLCNYTNYKNPHTPSLPNPFREKAGDRAGTMSVQCAYSPENIVNVSAKASN